MPHTEAYMKKDPLRSIFHYNRCFAVRRSAFTALTEIANNKTGAIRNRK